MFRFRIIRTKLYGKPSNIINNSLTCGNMGSGEGPSNLFSLFPRQKEEAVPFWRFDSSKKIKVQKDLADKGKSVSQASAVPTITGFLTNLTDVVTNHPHLRLTVKPYLKFLLHGACTFGRDYRYKHLVLPKYYCKADKLVMDEWLGTMDGLSWKKILK